MTDPVLKWAPEACTLPVAERPLRVAEFEELFASSLRGQLRLSITRLRWLFDPAGEATVRGLAARESMCCSFFAFTIAATDGDLQVDVEVPPGQVGVLNALEARAAAKMA